jgi:hypothetical protein
MSLKEKNLSMIRRITMETMCGTCRLPGYLFHVNVGGTRDCLLNTNKPHRGHSRSTEEAVALGSLC